MLRRMTEQMHEPLPYPLDEQVEQDTGEDE